MADLPESVDAARAEQADIQNTVREWQQSVVILQQRYAFLDGWIAAQNGVSGGAEG